VIKQDFNPSKLQEINPIEVLSGLGFSMPQIDRVLDGDVTAAVERTHKIDPIIDVGVVRKNYLWNESIDLIRWIFLKAKGREEFAAEEVEATRELYYKLFAECFRTARAAGFTFSLDEVKKKNENVLAKMDGDLYLMSLVDDDRLIMHLPS